MDGILTNNGVVLFELDPKMVFVTGWNEYVADMFKNGDVWKGRNFAFC